MKTISLIVALCLFSGCSILNNIAPSHEGKAALIRTTTSTALMIGIEEAVSPDENKPYVAYQCVQVAEMALDVLNSDEELDSLAVDVLLNGTLQINDPVFKQHMQNALDLLLANVQVPAPGELLGAEGKLYLTAFFEGVLSGAKVILEKYDALIPEGVDKNYGDLIDNADSLNGFQYGKAMWRAMNS